MNETFISFIPVLELLTFLFVFVIGLVILGACILMLHDLIQTKDAVLRNYPVIGHFRYIFSSLGEFFRQYFFAMDREEMPFNRAERQWVSRASRNRETTVAFGSSKNVHVSGTPIFVNCPFPRLEKDAEKTPALIIGEDLPHPYTAQSIVNISGMSYGALSRPAVLALSKGASLAGCWMNTGEGGLSPYHLEGGADIVFQIGTARFGVRDSNGMIDEDKLKEVAKHPQVKMFEFKMSQGAKPGKGGILPGAKVTEEIAKIRAIPVGEDAISPNRHPDIDNAEELLDAINKVRDITGKPVGFKAVIGAYGWLEELCRLINQRGKESAPDFITIDSGDGGTGAAPLPLIDNVGLCISESLPMVVDILTEHGLRDRIRVVTSGKLLTPADVAWALCAGADFITIARGFMFSLGCIQALKCNKNTCPTGITTHNPRLQKGLDIDEKSQCVANYARTLNHEIEIISHSCGIAHPRRFKRYFVRIMQANGKSIPLNELYPDKVAI